MLKRYIEKNAVANAYLIEGYGDVVAKAFNMAVVLLEADDARQERMRTHNDLNFIHIASPLKKEDVTTIQQQFQKSSMASGRRVYLIERIDEASISALNSLLKFLEDPEGDIVALLTSTKPQRVLETVRSRCISLPVLSQDVAQFKQAASDAGFDPLYGLYASYFTQSISDVVSVCESLMPVFDTFSEFEALVRDKSARVAGIFLQVSASKKNRAFTQDMFESFLKITAQSLPQFASSCAAVLDVMGPGMNVSFLIDQFVLDIRSM